MEKPPVDPLMEQAIDKWRRKFKKDFQLTDIQREQFAWIWKTAFREGRKSAGSL